jgi:transposase
MRSRIVLAAADGGSNTELAERLGVALSTVRRWRNRFAKYRLDGLLDEPRRGRPRMVDDNRIEALITATLETAPLDATHWSTRSMAAHLGMSQSTVSRVWRAFGLAPHKQDSWKLSADPLFVAKVRDVVGLYLNPPEQAVVLCVDEKTQIQALNRTQPVFPMLPGAPARASHDYVRHGTSSLYAALDVASGKVIGSLHARHRATEFLAFLKKIDAEVPPGPGLPRGLGQRLHAQDPGDQALADHPSALRIALHPDQLLLAQPRRTMLRRADQREAAPRHPHVGTSTQPRHSGLDRHLERQPAPVHLGQDRRPNPGQYRQLLHQN